MLSKENTAWLETTDDLKFAGYFIGLGPTKKERQLREKSLDIACLWCRLAEAGQDGRELVPEMEAALAPLLRRELKKSHDTVQAIWMEMCANCAKYRFAEIDEFALTKALYGIFRILLPGDQDIEPFDSRILEKLTEATGQEVEKTRQLTVAIRNRGIMSQVVLPEKDKSWTEYADQLVKTLYE